MATVTINLADCITKLDSDDIVGLFKTVDVHISDPEFTEKMFLYFMKEMFREMSDDGFFTHHTMNIPGVGDIHSAKLLDFITKEVSRTEKGGDSGDNI